MEHTSTSILLVDDELPIRITMGDILRRRGYDVTTAESGEAALELVFERAFDLLLLDLKLPGLSGIEVAQRVRQHNVDAAIIILTGHGSLESAVESIHLDVFDYMLKTSSPQEVVQRVALALKHQQDERRKQRLFSTLQSVVSELQAESPPTSEPETVPGEGWMTVGDLQISSWKQQARLNDQVLSLTPTEFRILACLVQQAGKVMSYSQIIHCAQGYDADAQEAVELVKPHIYHLRQKIEPDPSSPRYILTVRGTGYLFAAP